MSIPTPHITAKKGEFAKTVLMPGDPLRSQYIAETFLQNPVLINNIRGISGYTGTYNGQRISVMASGMGMPSMAIYSYELFNFYDVENIIRVGSAGAINAEVNLRDIVAAMGACTDSSMLSHYNLPGNFAPICSYSLLNHAVTLAEKMNINIKVGNVNSSDVFYSPIEEMHAWDKMGVLAVEMEAAALYINAAMAGKNALCLCTISDRPLVGDGLSAQERQISFNEMIELALKIAVIS